MKISWLSPVARENHQPVVKLKMPAAHCPGASNTGMPWPTPKKQLGHQSVLTVQSTYPSDLTLGICLKAQRNFSYVCHVSLGLKHQGLFTLTQFQVLQRPTLWLPSWGSCKNNSCMRVCTFTCSVMTDSLRPRVSVEFPGNNTGVGYHFLLPWIFLS